ncbi:hypothetical protein MHU86_1624 [Fragilaria crotonensis]|nr:hypothetical protein MHU86_1624 [Fragilaria crotonensis]
MSLKLGAMTMVRLLFAVIAVLAISSGSASLFDGENANDEATIKKVEAVKVETVKSVKARSLAGFTQAPTRKVGPPTPKPFSPTKPPSVRGTLAPGASGPDPICIIPSKKVYNCGEPISALFNYAYRDGPRQHPTFKDRIAIYPCYVNTYTRHAEVWQWGCGAPPANPVSCILPRSRGTVVFNRVPGYNGPKSDWPVAPNVRKSNGQTNTCFKIVILRTDNTPYYSYCEAKFTVKANSNAGCSVRDTSPSDP